MTQNTLLFDLYGEIPKGSNGSNKESVYRCDNLTFASLLKSRVQTGHLDQYGHNIGLLRNTNYFPLIGVA